MRNTESAGKRRGFNLSKLMSFRRPSHGLVFGLLWLVAVGFAVEKYREPQWSLDGVFYSVLARSDAREGDSSRPVYAETKQLASPAAFRSIAESSNHKRRVRKSQAEFDFQLPFYKSKVLYRAVNAGLTKASVSPVLAPYWVSTACFALIALLLPWWAMRVGAPPIAAYAASAAWLFAPQVTENVALAAPDMLGCLLLCAGLIALVSTPKPDLATGCFAAAALACPDLCLLGLAVLVGVRYRFRAWIPDGIRAAAIALSAAIATFATGAYSWPVVIRHNFVGAISKSTGPDNVTAAQYFAAVKRGIASIKTNDLEGIVPFAAAAAVVVALVLWRKSDVRNPLARNLLLLVWCGSALRFLAFPSLDDGMFLPAYAATVALGAALAAGAIQTLRQPGTLSPRAGLSPRGGFPNG